MSEINYSIVDRINQFIDYKKISVRRFCKEIGVSNGFLTKSKNIGSDKMLNIIYTYPEINPIWLLTGEESMILPKEISQNKSRIKVDRSEEIQEAQKAEAEDQRKAQELDKELHLLSFENDQLQRKNKENIELFTRQIESINNQLKIANQKIENLEKEKAVLYNIIEKKL